MGARAEDRIRRLINLYSRGAITETELSAKIADCAIDSRFFQHLDIVPDAVMTRLRRIAERAPAHPEDCLIIGSYSATAGFDYDSYDREQRETAYWAARRLREYFYPDSPMPKFEALKLVGAVDDAIESNGTIVISGDIQSHLIRRNPIHLITPDGRKIVTSSAGLGFIKRDEDQESSDPIIKRYGRHGIYLDQNVKSPLQIPPQSQVWVDRSEVAELPDSPRI